MLWRKRVYNQKWRSYANMLLEENRWRAQRYGLSEGLMDFGRGELVPFNILVDEWLELIMPDAEQLGCVAEVQNARAIIARGTSADLQRRVYEEQLAAGASEQDALRAVVDVLVEETVTDM